MQRGHGVVGDHRDASWELHTMSAPLPFALGMCCCSLLPLLVFMKSHMAGEPVEGICSPPLCRALTSFGEKWGVCSYPPVSMWPLSLPFGGLKGTFSFPTNLLCSLDSWSKEERCGLIPNFLGWLEFAFCVCPDRCSSSSFSANVSPGTSGCSFLWWGPLCISTFLLFSSSSFISCLPLISTWCWLWSGEVV